VRDGVAPDHQSIKAVARIFDQVLADPRVRYFGNVTSGVDLHHRELKRRYHQIVYAVGAQADRRMSIPGEDLPNSFPANSFVGRPAVVAIGGGRRGAVVGWPPRPGPWRRPPRRRRPAPAPD
jgi:NADPH-dependent glutamate synthase beta subunit-like oxidoreductase